MSQSEFWAEIHRLDSQVREVRASVDHRLAGFDLALLLLSASTDPAACKKRLAELREEMGALEKAQAALADDREATRKAAAEATADIERRRAAVLEREIAVRGREDGLRVREASCEEAPDPFPFDPNFGPGSRTHTGLARERHHE